MSGLLAAQTVPSFNIATYAGSTTAGYAGDGGAAASAQFHLPFGITIANGNLYIADQVNQRVRYITSGNVSTVAGDGTAGFNGDGAAAQKAELNGPSGVAVDKNSNLYIADTENFIVRMVTTGGQISTFAGNNSLGPGYSGDGDSAVNGQLSTPSGMAFDAKGNLYICDSGNNAIRVVTAGVFSTFAGDGVPDFLGDGGPATGAQLYNPEAIVFDASGNAYIADTLNNRVREVTTDGNIHTIAGNGKAGRSGDGGLAINAELYQPRGVAVDAAGNVYIADTFNNVIRVVLPTGQIATVAGIGSPGYGGDGGPAASAQLNFPTSLAFDSSGNLFVADTDNNVIRELTPAPAQPAGLPPSINAGVFTLGAYGGSTAIAPGTWIEIHGTNLAGDTRAWNGGDFNGNTAPTSLDGTSVHIGAQAAFVEYISSTQVNALIPSTIGSGPQQLTVTNSSGESAPYQITVDTLQPGLLAPSPFNIGGKQYATAVFSDGITYALPSNSVSGVTSRAAHPGDTIVMYGIGFGPVNPNTPAGQIANAAANLDLPLVVLFGQTPATVSYAGLAPGAVGLYQFNVVVPNTSGSAVPVSFTLGPFTSSQVVYVPVQ